MRARAQSFVALVILLACCVHASALDPSLDVSQYAHTTWRYRDGFAQGAISSIAQTPDGYLWLGTEFGLFRFDGVRAVPWQPPGNQHLPPGRIFSLLVSRNGTIWIGTGSGLASWKNGKLTGYPEFDGRIVFALLEDREGTMWAGAGGTPDSGKLCAIRGDSTECSGTDGQFGPGVVALYEDTSGCLWAGVKDGLWRWKPGIPKFYALPGEPDGIWALAEDSDGALLVGWKGGIFRFIDGKFRPYAVAGAVRPFRAHRMLRDRTGSIWIGTGSSGLLHLHQGRMDLPSKADDLTPEFVFGLFEDREGSIWISTDEGLDRYRDLAVTNITVNEGLSRNIVNSVLADKNGGVLLATSVGLNRWDKGQITIPDVGGQTRDGEINGSVPGSLFEDDRGRIWISTPRELGSLQNGLFTPIKDAPAGNVLSINQDTARHLWVINEPLGLLDISPQNGIQQIRWPNLGHKDNASALAVDRTNGGLWVGFFRGGISYLSDGRFRVSYTTTDGLGTGRVSDFYFDDEGTLWVSTEGGLSRLKSNRMATLTSKSGLPCDTVHWSIEDDDRSMWLYTACGLIRIAHSELDAWSRAADKQQGTTRRIKVTLFDSSDGVRSLASPGHYHPQVAKTPDGKIWFLPAHGVSVIDPRNLPFNKLPPPIHIEQIIADRQTYDTAEESGNPRLPSLIHDLEIDYTALSLVAPEKNRFRYKLEGADREWQDAGNRRQAFYTDLPPRHYRFRVLACNNSGVWNEDGAALDFVIPPAWYQTNWFRGACIAAFLMMIWGIHELRVRQLAAQFNMRLEERVAERTRIARDLHDTLLQSFQGLLLEFQAIAYRLQPGEIKNAQEAAIRGASQAITEGRDTVQGLRASAIEKNDLAEAIRAFGEELASSANNQSPVAFEVVVEGRRRRKHPFLRDEIYRIATEALRNAFRHAQADRIEVELRYADDAFTLRIRDNGRGIGRDILSADGRKGHFGLHGMSERAKLAGGELEIWSEVDSGTEIELTIPASRAYTTSARRFWWLRKSSQKDPDVKEKIES